MITDNRVNTANWKMTDGCKREGIQYRQYEADFAGVKVIKKTKRKKNVDGTDSGLIEWYVCNGFYFGNTRHLCDYLNEKEMKKERESKNNFKYSLDVHL